MFNALTMAIICWNKNITWLSNALTLAMICRERNTWLSSALTMAMICWERNTWLSNALTMAMICRWNLSSSVVSCPHFKSAELAFDSVVMA